MIRSYQKLWPQRSAVKTIMTHDELEEHILIELNDELTHPRVRKNKKQKLELALLRITESELLESEKKELVELYKKIALKKDK
ncbi:hypothetical protein [Planococcus versutus]|uniref:Uncharacterized protein n=1 Tax=Planococcus versutus TaxID=1302659 RepID=A0A1B1S4W4_9BACL|nr:hypothetical protein [Planococcus versutus]ANU28232.1 hypothetical protein I858_014670 [Planococcus versutus]